jgi:hypothetical protein
LKINAGGKIFDVAYISRAPRREPSDVTTFLDKLDEVLTDLGNDLNNINATSTSMYLDLIGSHGFFTCNENTTSMATQSASLIDHFMVNDLSKRIDITQMPFRNLDHELMFGEAYHAKYLIPKTPLMKISKRTLNW